MKISRLAIQIWIPFVFSLALSGIVLLTGLAANIGNVHPAFPAFFCFLPMAFFFVANATWANYRALEKRIEELEKTQKQ